MLFVKVVFGYVLQFVVRRIEFLLVSSLFSRICCKCVFGDRQIVTLHRIALLSLVAVERHAHCFLAPKTKRNVGKRECLQ